MCIFLGYILTHIWPTFRLYFDPTFCYSLVSFQSDGSWLLEPRDMVVCQISCHVVWLRIAISSASWDFSMWLKCAYKCQKHIYKLIREEHREKSVQSFIWWWALEFNISNCSECYKCHKFQRNSAYYKLTQRPAVHNCIFLCVWHSIFLSLKEVFIL